MTHVTSKHIREVGYCVPHMRKFAERNGFSLRTFMHDGADAEILDSGLVRVTCGGVVKDIDDAQILKLVQVADRGR